jgi:hypothetical protein
MSATVQSLDFLEKAEGLVTALEDAREELDRAAEIVREIAAAASGDDCGGLPRLGFAVAAEAESLAGVFRDTFDPAGFDFDARIGDACDLCSLIELALGRAVEAVAS